MINIGGTRIIVIKCVHYLPVTTVGAPEDGISMGGDNGPVIIGITLIDYDTTVGKGVNAISMGRGTGTIIKGMYTHWL